MRQTRAIELGTGLFVLLGFAALFFLVTQITSREFGLGSGGYRLTASFDQIGSLKPGAPVSMSGVTIGRVESIAYDFNEYRALVALRIDPQYDKIPDDSDASILTAGLLGRPVRRDRRRRLGNLFQGRRSNTVHAVRHRAREPDQQVPVLEGRGATAGGRIRPGSKTMTRRFAITLAALLLPALIVAVARAAEAVPGPAPQELIETTARKLLEALDADREQAKKDPARVRKLVDEILLPHFDTDYSARLVLGTHWRTATPEQRRRSSTRSTSRCSATTARR